MLPKRRTSLRKRVKNKILELRKIKNKIFLLIFPFLEKKYFTVGL